MLIKEIYVYLSHWQGNESYYVLNIEDPEEIVEYEDQSDVSDNTYDPVNFEFPSPIAELQPDEQNRTMEKTDVLVFLDIVGKLIDDIRSL